MGRIERQSIINTIITYAGMGLGYVNILLLFPNFLEENQVGLVNLLINISALVAQFSTLGFANVTLKFFPYFRTDDKKHHGYLLMFCLVSLVGFALFAIISLIFKQEIAAYFSKSTLLLEYFWYVLPLTFFTIYYNVLMAYLRSLHLTVMPSFFKEFLVKILITMSISAFALGWIDFPTFVMLYVVVNISVTFMVLAYAWRIGEIKFTRFRIPSTLTFRMLLVYGLFALLGNSSSLLTGKLDGVIIADIMDEYWVGIYATVFTLISAIDVPTRSMYKIASPQVAEYWSKNDMPRLAHLYKRVSLINTILGTILFIGIWINLDNIFAFVPESYAEGRYVILIVGIGKLFDLITGLNGIIILTSDKYRWDMLFNLLLVGLVISLDYALIPEYGIEGAAIGTMLALVAFNLSRLSFVRYFYKMHPFSWRILLVLLIAGIALLPGLFIPRMPPIIDLIVRSSVVSIIFFGGVYLLKVSDDVNRIGNRLLRKVGIGR